jgi:hypothetical protein
MGVDGLEQPHLVLECEPVERVVVAIEAGIAAPGRLRVVPGVAALDRAHRIGRPCDRGFGDIGSVGVADRLVLHGAQSEALRGVVGRLLEPSVVEVQHLGLAIFEKELAVVGAFERAREVRAGILAVDAGAVEQRHGGGRHVGLGVVCTNIVMDGRRRERGRDDCA